MSLSRLTKIDGGGISTTSDYRVGVITATKFVGPIEGDVTGTGSITATDGTFSGNVSIAGTLTYEDVTNIDSVGIITAAKDIHVGAGVSAVGVITGRYLNPSSVSTQNVIIGWEQSARNVTGSWNVLIGRRAGEQLTSGGSAVCIGANAGQLLGGSNGIFIGGQAGSKTTGSANLFIGSNAGQQTTSAGACTIIGHLAGIDNQGSNNTILGYYAGRGNSGVTDGAQNTFIGAQSGFKIEGGDDNTGVGWYSLKELLGGNKNVAIGRQAGDALVSGSNNIIIGYQADASTSSTSNEITLGDANINHLRIPGIGVSFNNTAGTQLGIITATELDISGDIDVDGHTNLDNVNVAGVTTFSNTVYVGTGTTIETNGQATFSGITTHNFIRLPNYVPGTSVGKIQIGDLQGYEIFHYNNNNYLTFTRNLLIRGDATGRQIKIQPKISQNGLIVNPDGAVELYHSGTKRLETSSVGVSIPQDLDVDGHTNLDNVSIAGVTTTSRLDISSTTPIIDFLESDGNPDYRLYAEGGEFVIRQQNPSVSNRLVINSTGISVPNDLDVDGHTNLDNVSVAGITTGGGFKTAGTSSDGGVTNGFTAGRISIYDNGSHNIFRIGTHPSYAPAVFNSSNIVFSTNGFYVRNTAATRNYIGINNTTGILQLGYGASSDYGYKLETSAKGIKVGTGVTIETNGNSNFVGVSSLGTGDTGAVYLYNPDADALSGTTNDIYGWKAKTYTSGLQVNSAIYLSRSGSNGLSLSYNNATGSYITALSGFLRVGVPYGGDSVYYGNNIYLKDRLESKTFAHFEKVSGTEYKVNLYGGDGVKQFETTTKGIQVGTGVTVETNGQATYTGIVTASAFKLSDGSAVGATDKIEEGNSKIEVVDTGTGSLSFVLDGSEKLNMGSYAQFNQNVFVDATLQVSGQLQVADAILHMNNSPTRIRFPENNVIELKTDNVVAARIDQNQNMNVAGIVTASSFKLADGSNVGGVDSDAQYNTVGGTNAGEDLNSSSGYNVLFGYDAGKNVTSAQNNVAIGANALDANTDKSGSIAIGKHALGSSNAAVNIAIGYMAASGATNLGTYNIFLGRQAGDVCQGNNNLMFGRYAGRSVTSGDDNVIIGDYSAYTGTNNLTTGDNNIIIGHDAAASSASVSNEITLGDTSINHLRVPGIGVSFSEGGGVVTGIMTASSFKLLDGSAVGGVESDAEFNTVAGTNAGNALDSDTYRNTLFGYDTGKLIDSGDDNTLIGYDSGKASTSGYRNTAVGSAALLAVTDGANNAAFGYQALDSVTGGARNTAVGKGAGAGIVGANNNTYVGMNAGEAHTAGNNNIVIGYTAALSSTTISNEVVIGNASITRFRIPGIGLDLTSAPMANVVEDSSPQLGGDLDCNGNNISLDNNNRINLGSDNDLILKVTDTNSTITHNGTGNLFISTEGTDEDLYLTAADDIFLRVQGSENGIRVIGNGAVELYHDNAIKIKTQSFGADIYGLVQISGNCIPDTNNAYNLGTSSARWANIYSADLQLSNKGSQNDVDGTWGDYTIQEGESDLFLINNRSGKKYKFNLTEVS